MRTIILLVFLFATHILNAQDDVYDHFPIKQKINTNNFSLYGANFCQEMKLTDTAKAYLFKLDGDTCIVTIRYSKSGILEKMQSFVYTESTNSVKIYNPMELKGYCVFIDTAVWCFYSVENTLGIVSPLTAIKPFKQQSTVTENKKIFLRILEKGGVKLYKYITALNIKSSRNSAFISTGPDEKISITGNGQQPYIESYISLAAKYCLQKGDGILVKVSKETVSDFFHDCAEAQNIISENALKEEEELKKLTRTYNAWKEEMSTRPARY